MRSLKPDGVSGRITYRKPGEDAWCENCGAALCIHLKRFCSDECRDEWFAKQPDIQHYCVTCGVSFMGKPWRKRCDPCAKRPGPSRGAQ